MSQTNINIRVDENLKKQFDTFCDEVGLTMTAAFNLFMKAVIREQRIPFELSLNVPNAETKKAIEDVEKGVGLSKTYNNLDELFKDLDAES